MTDQDGSELIPVYKIPIEHLDQEAKGRPKHRPTLNFAQRVTLWSRGDSNP